MQTPPTEAGRLTELCMKNVRESLPELSVHVGTYNRIYSAILLALETDAAMKAKNAASLLPRVIRNPYGQPGRY